jgi:hypothetical protein
VRRHDGVYPQAADRPPGHLGSSSVSSERNHRGGTPVRDLVLRLPFVAVVHPYTRPRGPRAVVLGWHTSSLLTTASDWPDA